MATTSISSPLNRGADMVGRRRLSSRGESFGTATSQQAHGGDDVLARKVQRALRVDTDTPAMAAALEALGGLGEKDLDARSVRAAIERDALEQARRYERELRGLVDVCRNLRTKVTAVKTAASKVERSSNSVAFSTEEDEAGLARTLAEAFRARDVAARRAERVATFLDEFDLSDADAYLLDHYGFDEFRMSPQQQRYHPHTPLNHKPGQNGAAFLTAIGRASSIRRRLRDVLVDERRLGATSALRMMDALAARQERAYRRLYDWLRSHLRLFESGTTAPTSSSDQQFSGRRHSQTTEEEDDDDYLDEALAHGFVRRSLYVLKQGIPAYHRHVLELVAAGRRSGVTRRFLLALTSGPAPIEMKAHDPVGYTNDMLAFVFRSLSVELELARGLFRVEEEWVETDNKDSDDESHQEEETKTDIDEVDVDVDALLTPAYLLGHAMSGVTRPLSARISQVVASLARRPERQRQRQRPGAKTRGVVEDMDNVVVNVGHNDDDTDDEDVDIVEEESIVARTRISALYSICGLLLFYCGAMNKSVRKLSDSNDESNENKSNSNTQLSLLQSMDDCRREATTAYATSLRVYVAMLDSFAANTAGDSEATLGAALLVHVAGLRGSSPGFMERTTTPWSSSSNSRRDANKSNDSKEEGDDTVVTDHLSLEYLCETIMESVLSTTKVDKGIATKSTPTISMDDIYALIHALESAKRSGLHPLTHARWSKILEETKAATFEAIVQRGTDEMLNHCGLGGVWKSIQHQLLSEPDQGGHEDVDLSSSLQTVSFHLDEETLKNAVSVFYGSLYSPPLPTFEDLSRNDELVRKAARSKAAANVASIYRQIHDHVQNAPEGTYGDAASFLGHSPDQVETLLAVS